MNLAYRIFSLVRSPNCGERGPVKPLLKDKSLNIKSIDIVNIQIHAMESCGDNFL